MSVDTVLSRLSGRGIVTAVAALVLALVLALGVSRCQLANANERHAASALRADSTEAANDSTRAFAISERERAKLLGDSLAGVERRAVQVAQKADALDRALGRERLARIEMTATIKALETRGTSTGGVTETRGAEDSVSVRHAVFDVRSEPYTVHARVSLPPAPAPGMLDSLRVAIDTVRLTVRPGCGSTGVDGIRPATVSVVGPRWLPIALTRVEQSPDLCRSPALQPRGVSRVRWFLIGAGTVVSVGGLAYLTR